jgi:hypothetical protein
MSHLNAIQVRALMAGIAAGALPEHPSIDEDWSRRASADYALTNTHDPIDTDDANRRQSLDAAEMAALRAAICRASELALKAYRLTKQRYLFDDVYCPVAEETYLAALIFWLDELLPARFRADTEAMLKAAPAKGADK